MTPRLRSARRGRQARRCTRRRTCPRPVADPEGCRREHRRERERDSRPGRRWPAAGERNLGDGCGEARRYVVRRRRYAAEQRVARAQPLELLGRELADELVEVRRLFHGRTSSSRPARRASPVRVLVFTVPEGHVEVAGDLGLREPAPVGELEHGALALGKLLEGAVDAPGEPGALGLLGGPGLGGCLLGNLDDGLAPLPGPVDDRMACDGVEPGRAEPRSGR